jgi:hypothetical protein
MKQIKPKFVRNWGLGRPLYRKPNGRSKAEVEWNDHEGITQEKAFDVVAPPTPLHSIRCKSIKMRFQRTFNYPLKFTRIDGKI